jgi:hypothetical protein
MQCNSWPPDFVGLFAFFSAFAVGAKYQCASDGTSPGKCRLIKIQIKNVKIKNKKSATLME